MFFSKKGGEQFVQRINPTVEDFTIGDFVWDSVVRPLDLSAIVPANAKRVLISIEIKSTEAGNFLAFYPANSTTYWDITKVGAQAANIMISDVYIIPLTTPQTLQYMAKIYSGTIIFLEVIVMGWFK